MNISISAETLFHVGSFPITNSLMATWLTVILLAGVALLLKRKVAAVPGRGQAAAEMVLEGTLGIMDSITDDRKQTRRYLPLVATIFFFVIVSNWLGLFPLFGPIGLHETHEGQAVLVPLFRGANADLNTTLALAIITVLTVQVVGVMSLGFFKYASKFINLKKPATIPLGLLELVSEISRLISLSFRLFGNIFAGEVLLFIIVSLVPYIAPLPFLFLEVFVGFIQAFIFAMLTLVFIKIATLEVH